MNTLTEVLKIFPVQMSRISKLEKPIKQKPKTIAFCFSEGVVEGCRSFAKEMGH